MKHSLAECRPAAAARQGRQAAHVAPDAAPRARATTSPTCRSPTPAQTEARPSTACAKCAAASRRCRAPMPAKGTLRFYADAAALPRRSAAVRGRQVPLGRVSRAASTQLLATRQLRSRSSATSCCRWSTCRDGCPARRSSSRTTSRRRSGAGTPRTATQPASRGALLDAAVAAHAALRGAARSRASICARRLRGRPRHVRAPLSGRAARRRSTSCRPASTPSTSRRIRRRRARRAHLVFTGSMDWLPNEDGMLYFCRDILPLIRAGGARTPRSASSAARRRRRCSKLADEPGVEVTGRVDDVRPHIADAARLHRAAAHRRRHAAEDLRGDGDGQGRRLDDRSAPKACR